MLFRWNRGCWLLRFTLRLGEVIQIDTAYHVEVRFHLSRDLGFDHLFLHLFLGRLFFR